MEETPPIASTKRDESSSHCKPAFSAVLTIVLLATRTIGPFNGDDMTMFTSFSASVFMFNAERKEACRPKQLGRKQDTKTTRAPKHSNAIRLTERDLAIVQSPVTRKSSNNNLIATITRPSDYLWEYRLVDKTKRRRSLVTGCI